MEPLKRIPLNDVHRHSKARMIDFASWYTSILEEHRAVRSRAGIFDVSNMGLGYVPTELATIGNDIGIMIRDKLVIAHIVSTKFYKRGARNEPQGI